MITIRRTLLFLASTALGIVLVVLLVRGTRIDFAQILHQLKNVSRLDFAKLVALNAGIAYFSTAKWRTVDKHLRRPSDSIPRWRESFGLTAIGMALACILPVQLGMMTARTIGTFFRGRALPRGAGGTLFEQSFDLLTVMVFAIASAITLLLKSHALTWTGCAGLLFIVVLTAIGPSLRLIGFLALLASKLAPKGGRVEAALRKLHDQEGSALLSNAVCRQLFFLSTVRFVLVVLMAFQTAAAIGARIPLWQLAAATPMVTVATAAAITPGALGISEFTFASVLAAFGTPLSVSVPWTLAYRVLGTAACFCLAALGTVGMLVKDTIRAHSPHQLETVAHNKSSEGA